MIEVTVRVHTQQGSYQALVLHITNTGDHPEHPVLNNYRVDVAGSDGMLMRSVGAVKGHVRAHGMVPLIKRAFGALPKRGVTTVSPRLVEHIAAAARAAGLNMKGHEL